MPHHEQDAALLAGGLYLSLGMHNEAGRRFEALLTDKVPAALRNRAWFYLAKVWYARSYYDRSEQSLGHISGELAPGLEAERQHLLVNVLMRQNRFDEAATLLAHWQGPADWMAFARFNLGVALVRQNRMEEAAPVLTSVGTMPAAGSELLALRDKANLALGYAWLQAKNPAAARVALDRVRLARPYSTRAPQSRYLYSLLAENDFQEGLKNYRDLAYPGGTLKHWDESMDAFAAMIATRQLADGGRLPRADALLAGDAPAKLLAARAAIDSRPTATETRADVAALGTGKERAQWSKLRPLESALGSASGGDSEDLQTERDKIRLMKGVLYWRFDAQFKERSYAERRALRAVDAALNEAQNRWVRVQKARGSVPSNTGEFAARIAALAERITQLRLALANSTQQQSRYLELLARTALLA